LLPSNLREYFLLYKFPHHLGEFQIVAKANSVRTARGAAPSPAGVVRSKGTEFFFRNQAEKGGSENLIFT
jgi:hypothetical protein